MKPIFTKHLRVSYLTLLLLIVSQTTQAQTDAQVLPLQAEELQRLGIRFAPVQPISQNDGFRVPAMVTHSPDSLSAISSRSAAVLKKWHAAGGEWVEAGAAVVTLVSSELMLVEQQWLTARQTLTQMQGQQKRDQELFDEGIIARQRLQQSKRDLNQARFDLRVWQQQLQQKGLTNKDLDQLYQGKLPPGEITLKSPKSGVLSRSFVLSGEPVSANQKLASVTNNNELWVHASVNAPLAQLLPPSAKLAVLEDTAPLQLVSKNLDIAEQTQTIELQARFSDTPALHPGQQVTLLIGGQQSGWQVPAAAVIHTEGKAYVYVRQAQGVEARKLHLLPLGQGYLASSGLKAGEELVIQGTAQLKGIQLGLGGGE